MVGAVREDYGSTLILRSIIGLLKFEQRGTRSQYHTISPSQTYYRNKRRHCLFLIWFLNH